MNAINQIPENAVRLEKMPERIPYNGTFELTVRCNLHCKMCLFRHADCENAQLIKQELTAAQWIDMARQAAEAGTIQLLITGGEPMLRPDFCEIWEGIYQLGFLMELYTNATLVTPRIMETLRKYPPHKIGVTIYGASAETYEKVCGSADAFEKALAGMHQLQTLPSLMTFRTTVIQDNLCDVTAIDDLICAHFGKDYVVVNADMVTKAVRGGCADVESCRLNAEQNFMLPYHRALDYMKSRIGESFDEKNVRFSYADQSENREKSFRLSLIGCDAGMNRYTVTWDGKLLGCQILDVFSTDALRDGFQTAWSRFPNAVKLPSEPSDCINCKDRELCECCPAFRYTETGKLDGVPVYICQTVRAKKSKFVEDGL